MEYNEPNHFPVWAGVGAIGGWVLLAPFKKFQANSETRNRETGESEMRIRNAWLVVTLAVALSLVTGCSSTDVGIATKVELKLAADGVVKGPQIDVTASNGVITLTGNVDSKEAKARALALARDTEGVVKVVDMIAARTDSGNGNAPDTDRTIGEVFDDAAITLSVKNKLFDDSQIKGLKIDVDTRDGVVFLTGSVRSDTERKRAIRLATDTKGVKSVEANLTLQTI